MWRVVFTSKRVSGSAKKLTVGIMEAVKAVQGFGVFAWWHGSEQGQPEPVDQDHGSGFSEDAHVRRQIGMGPVESRQEDAGG
jgi:hypothetical protein